MIIIIMIIIMIIIIITVLPLGGSSPAISKNYIYYY